MAQKRGHPHGSKPGEARYRRKSEPGAVDQILKSALKAAGLDDKIAKYSFVSAWPEIVGEEIARRSRPECIRGKTLVVRVADSVWAQELTFHKKTILARVQRHLKDDTSLDDVAFLVGEIAGR